jgi:hypothetical protein
MNKGIDVATGEWINFMNVGDGLFAPSVLAEMFVGNKHNNIDILYGNHQVIYPSGRKRIAKAGVVDDLWKGSQFCHQATFVRTLYHKQYKFNICTKIVADFEFLYNAWKKNNVLFKYKDVVVANFEAGGVSDINRVDSILGWWFFVDKSLKNNIYYCFLVLKESVKLKIKNAFNPLLCKQ